jgi:hypothetical protein
VARETFTEKERKKRTPAKPVAGSNRSLDSYAPRALPRSRRCTPHDPRPVRLAYQPPANSTFLSEQTSHQQPTSSTFLSEQTSTSHQPPAKRTGCAAPACWAWRARARQPWPVTPSRGRTATVTAAQLWRSGTSRAVTSTTPRDRGRHSEERAERRALPPTRGRWGRASHVIMWALLIRSNCGASPPRGAWLITEGTSHFFAVAFALGRGPTPACLLRAGRCAGAAVQDCREPHGRTVYAHARFLRHWFPPNFQVVYFFIFQTWFLIAGWYSWGPRTAPAPASAWYGAKPCRHA